MKKVVYGRVSVTPALPYFRVRWREGGRSHERSTRDYVEACRLAKDTNDRLEAGQVGAPVGSFAAVLDAATHRSHYPRYDDDSWNNIRSLLRHQIIPYLGDLKAKQVRHQDLQAHLEFLLFDEEMSKHTVSKVRTIFVRTGKYGVREGIWTEATNPAASLQVPASSAGAENDVQMALVPADQIPTDDQVASLLDAAWEDSRRNWFILAMAAGSGLRWSEITGLRASDFDFAARTVYVQRARRTKHDGTVVVKGPKTVSGRRKSVIAAAYLDGIREFVESQPTEGFLVRTKFDTVLRRSSFTRPMKRYHEVSDYPEHLSVHSLRHFFGSRCVRLGVGVADVSQMMGHSSPQVTMTLYVHGDSSSVDRALALL